VRLPADVLAAAAISALSPTLAGRDCQPSAPQDSEALKQKFPKDYKVIRPYLRLTSQPNKSWP
jgi:hypothetical protein